MYDDDDRRSTKRLCATVCGKEGQQLCDKSETNADKEREKSQLSTAEQRRKKKANKQTGG